MKYFIEAAAEPGVSRLVMTVTKAERRILSAYRRKDNAGRLGRWDPKFHSDDFLYELIENMFTNDCFTWLPEGVTGDMTSAPMIAILGDEVELLAKDNTTCSGFYQMGSGGAAPVLQRWAFMDYAVTSPQAELADEGRCEWQGGDYWGTQEAAAAAISLWKESRNAIQV